MTEYCYTTLRNATKYETILTSVPDSSNILSICNFMKCVFKSIQNIPRTIFSPCFWLLCAWIFQTSCACGWPL